MLLSFVHWCSTWWLLIEPTTRPSSPIWVHNFVNFIERLWFESRYSATVQSLLSEPLNIHTSRSKAPAWLVYYNILGEVNHQGACTYPTFLCYIKCALNSLPRTKLTGRAWHSHTFRLHRAPHLPHNKFSLRPFGWLFVLGQLITDPFHSAGDGDGATSICTFHTVPRWGHRCPRAVGPRNHITQGMAIRIGLRVTGICRSIQGIVRRRNGTFFGHVEVFRVRQRRHIFGRGNYSVNQQHLTNGLRKPFCSLRVGAEIKWNRLLFEVQWLLITM